MNLAALQQALGTGQWSQAERMLRPVASQAGAPAPMLYNYGKVLLELGRPSDAVRSLRKAVTQAPTHGNAWFELGRAALLAQDLHTAAEAFDKALRCDPQDIAARRNLGRVLLRLGRYHDACATWACLAGDEEADLALYRCAAETADPKADQMRQDLLANHPNRAAVIRTLVRVSRGAVPLDLRPKG